LKAQETRQHQKEKSNVQRKKHDPDQHREDKLLRYLHLWNLFLRVQEERLQLPGEWLRVRLP
jgi:hypothetical protein